MRGDVVDTTVLPARTGGDAWDGDWFDADVDGNRLPISLGATATGGDIGTLAERVLAHVGR